MPYFLQNYNPCLVAATSQSSFDDCTTVELSLLNEPSSLGPGASSPKSKGKGTHSAVNKTYSLALKLDVLKYAGIHSESETARHFDRPHTTIQG